MGKNSKHQSTSKALTRRSPFGPPPILEGENAEDYNELFERVFSAARPTNFIEEIWVRDVVDVTWTLLRLRRIQAAYLTTEVSDAADKEASSLATDEAKLMEGMDEETKNEMNEFLNNDSGLSWEEMAAQNPRANEIFQELYESAKSMLDMNAMQAKVMIYNLDTIERIEHLIMIEERRFDAVIREIDRHRFTQKQLNSVQDVLDAEFKIVTPKINGRKTSTKKAA